MSLLRVDTAGSADPPWAAHSGIESQGYSSVTYLQIDQPGIHLENRNLIPKQGQVLTHSHFDDLTLEAFAPAECDRRQQRRTAPQMELLNIDDARHLHAIAYHFRIQDGAAKPQRIDSPLQLLLNESCHGAFVMARLDKNPGSDADEDIVSQTQVREDGDRTHFTNGVLNIVPDAAHRRFCLPGQPWVEGGHDVKEIRCAGKSLGSKQASAKSEELKNAERHIDATKR